MVIICFNKLFQPLFDLSYNIPAGVVGANHFPQA